MGIRMEKATLLKGAPVAAALCEKAVNIAKDLNVTPTLAIVRVGDKGDDIYYQRSATKRCEGIGQSVRSVELPVDVSEQELIGVIEGLNADNTVHGVLLLRPLPKHINEEAVCETLSPKKDIDGITGASLAGVFTGNGVGFAPCTARACIEILDHYGIEMTGKRATVVGRSLVVGKPVAMMLMSRNATVTVCHTKTIDMPLECKKAEILIVSAGRAEVIGEEHLTDGQIVVDVGINVDKDGNLCGDVKDEAAKAQNLSYTPVPGGVGTVTTAVLACQLAEAARSI